MVEAMGCCPPAPGPSTRLRTFLRPKPGQSMVEFQLIVPLLAIIIFGIIEFALAIHTEIDFNGAVSDGIRQATIVGADTTNDDSIGQAMFQTMRADDPDRSNYYTVELLQSRSLTDAGATDTYENFYTYNHATHSFNIDPYAYIADVLASRGSVPTPCQYFYEAHEVVDVATGTPTVYLDQSEDIELSPSPTSDTTEHLASALSNSDLLQGCGRTYYIDGTPPESTDPVAYDTTWTCANDGAAAPGITGNLCYYYPEERINSVEPLVSNDTGLTDEIEVDINYTYKPLGDFVASHSPLGLGFTVTEHARGRIEPMESIDS